MNKAVSAIPPMSVLIQSIFSTSSAIILISPGLVQNSFSVAPFCPQSSQGIFTKCASYTYLMHPPHPPAPWPVIALRTKSMLLTWFLKQHKKEPCLFLYCHSHLLPLYFSALITLASFYFVSWPDAFPPGVTALFLLFTSPFKCHFYRNAFMGHPV